MRILIVEDQPKMAELICKGLSRELFSHDCRGGVRGFDGHEPVKGRRRYILVDTLGIPIPWRVEPGQHVRSTGSRALARWFGAAVFQTFEPLRPMRGMRAVSSLANSRGKTVGRS
jgi:hypothetical protein